MSTQIHRKQHPGEVRLPAALAVLVAISLYAALPEGLVLGPRLAVPVLEAALFLPLVAANPRRLTRDNRWLRRVSISLVLLIAATNAASLVLLVRALVSGAAEDGPGLLLHQSSQGYPGDAPLFLFPTASSVLLFTCRLPRAPASNHKIGDLPQQYC